jgi:hypothetical protein
MIMSGLTIGVNRRCRGGAVVGDEKSEGLVGKVTRRGSVRVERWVRCQQSYRFHGSHCFDNIYC